MSEKKIIETYANSLALLSKTILSNNTMEKKQHIVIAIKKLNKATENILSLLEYDDKVIA